LGIPVLRISDFFREETAALVEFLVLVEGNDVGTAEVDVVGVAGGAGGDIDDGELHSENIGIIFL
jgi:hypothetical protein